MTINTATVYASSSRGLDAGYYDAARRLGEVLAGAGTKILYGGGGAGSMGAMADGALAAGGEVHGVIPHFLAELEAGHTSLTSMRVVNDMHTRKRLMLEDSDAVVTLPGGCGTFEELFEALTFKRLGLFLGPIVLVNTNRYYDGCVSFLEHSVRENFMSAEHGRMWSVVDEPEQVPQAFADAHQWTEEMRQFSSVAAD